MTHRFLTAGLFPMFVALELLTFSVTLADSVSHPFVAGFDRFGEHDEIGSNLSSRLLISELSCAACHKSEDPLLQPKSGPRLREAGTRLSGSWVKRFIAAPHVAKPGTTMPDVLAGKDQAERQDIAASLAAFLSTQTGDYPPVKASGTNPVPYQFWNKGDVENGRVLYHQVGCVACHDPDQDYEGGVVSDSPVDRLLDELDTVELADLGLAAAARRVHSVPHGDLASKYSQKSLTFFLIDPLKIRPEGRMPSMKLAAIEAADLAAYLLSTDQVESSPSMPIDDSIVEQGRRLFTELRCVNCHDAGDVADSNRAKDLVKLELDSADGCLTGNPVDYSLSDQQRDHLRRSLGYDRKAEKLSGRDTLDLVMLQLNCYGCHQRDEIGGVGRYRKSYFHTLGDIDLGDEGRLPPPLTHVGQKLTKSRLENVLLGKKADVRPHMHIRMPIFGSRSREFFPKIFAEVDKPDKSSDSLVFEKIGEREDVADIGRRLMDIGCVQCHQFRGHTLPGVLGVDLSGIDSRVHPDWFHDFLMDPGSLKARTRMPTFFPDGKSQHPQLLGGNPRRQIGAMWAYLKDLEAQPLPEKIEQSRSQNYELVPAQKPIVLRTFISGVGTHGIAVGFPERVHFAFDAEQSRLALAWRERFLDAQGTWFIRFAPPADPLGKSIIQMPRGPLVVSDAERDSQRLDRDTTVQFMGYRVDSNGVPTFLYRIGQLLVEDKVEPAGDAKLKRSITLSQSGASSTKVDSELTTRREKLPVWLRLNEGKSLAMTSSFACRSGSGLTVTLTKPSQLSGIIREVNGREAWHVPIDLGSSQGIQVEYSW